MFFLPNISPKKNINTETTQYLEEIQIHQSRNPMITPWKRLTLPYKINIEKGRNPTLTPTKKLSKPSGEKLTSKIYSKEHRDYRTLSQDFWFAGNFKTKQNKILLNEKKMSHHDQRLPPIPLKPNNDF